MKKLTLWKPTLLLLYLMIGITAVADDLSNGEWAWLSTGEPAMTGQTTNDHLFVRTVYDDAGFITTEDNLVSFSSGDTQVVAFWLDDDEIYLNDNVQALTPVAYDVYGNLYNEITYNSLKADIYLPMSMQLVTYKFPGESRQVNATGGERLPWNSYITWSEKETKIVDGKEYRVYTLVISNSNNDACHFSGRDPEEYAQNGALRKDDAPLFYLAVHNDNQDADEGRLDQDMIIANLEFGFREGVRDHWTPNEYRFIFGTGGNNETQRFQYYNRVALYGSNGPTVLASSIELSQTVASLNEGESLQLTANVKPANTSNKTVTWKSSNPNIATVTSNGIVTGITKGTATITATTTDGTYLSASCQVTVNRLVTSITLNESSLVMHIGETAQLQAEVFPQSASSKTLSWSSGNPSVASVDNNGVVTAIAAGTTYIEASATDGSSVSARCDIEVLPDYYITLDTIYHARGSSDVIVDLPVGLVNKNLISGIQFDVTLPSNISFNLVGGEPDVWLDNARSTSTHSISASQLSNGKYRVLITSLASKNLKGNDGVLAHMNLVFPRIHNTGNYTISLSNIIASESDETRHTLNNTSTIARFCYMVGDADANAVVDIADHTSSASKILGRNPSPFYNDAADVDGNSSLDVVDLVGITNIALEIKPITYRQAPSTGWVENRLFCDRLKLNAEYEAEVNIGIDCGFDFAGFQMDLSLPQGLTLMAASLGEEASKLGLVTETMPDGKIRLLGTSFSEAEVNGACPNLMTLRVKAERNYMPGSRIEFENIVFAERNLTGHYFDGMSVDYVEPSIVHELMDNSRIYVENGKVIVETPVAGTVQIIAVDGRMVEHKVQVGRNVYAVDADGIFIIHFNGKTLKVRL